LNERNTRRKTSLKKFGLLGFVGILVCTFLASYPICAQEQEQEDSLQYEVAVTLKLIQVYVSDKEGNPIHDLTKEDFLVYDNGRLIEVTDFEIHRLDPPPKKEAEALPRMSRKFFLLLDAYRNDGFGLKKARNLALHFIKTQIHHEDELGLLSYSIERGLVLHIPLTKDHAKIQEAVNAIKLFPGITDGSLRDIGITSMDNAVDFTDGLSDFAVSLRYEPGYKHIILFSAGLPRDLFESDDPRLRFHHERMAKELASSSCPIYTIDTQGQRDNIQGREQKGDHSLRRLAALTGGSHFTNVDYQDAISADIQNSTGNYYVLGYYVEEAWDGKYHEIKVRTKRKGVRIQAQKGYFSPKAYRKFDRLEKRLHLLDLARSPNPQFDLPQDIPSISRPWRDSDSLMVLNLTEIIPADLQKILADKAEFFTLVYDDEGILIAEGKNNVDYTKNPPKRICMYTFFPHPPGKYEYITILRNRKTGAVAKAVNTVAIPEDKKSQPLLAGPLFFFQGSGTLCLQTEIKHPKGKSTKQDLNLGVIAPKIDGSISPLVAELSKSTAALYAIFGLEKEERDELVLEFVPSLRSKTTDETFPLKHSIRNDINPEHDNTLVLELELTPVPPGQYALEIAVSGTSPVQTRVFSQDIIIR
jgi:VWFA-related protein